MSQKLENIEACLFDAYGTLFDVASSARHCSAEIGENWLDFSVMWRNKQLEYTWLRSLMGRFDDFWQVTGDALDYTMANFHMHNPALRARLMELYLRLDTYPEVPLMLKGLKDRGIKTGILSNGSRSMLISATRKAGIQHLLDGIYSADHVQTFKVDPRVYQYGVDQTGVPADRVAFMSANAWDAVGAMAFGMQVAWVNRFGQRQERVGVKVDREIKSLDQLQGLLDG